MCCSSATRLLLALLGRGTSTLRLFLGDVDTCNSVGDCCNICLSFYTTNISIRSVKKTIEASISIDIGGSTLSIDASIVIGIVMKSNIFGPCSPEDRSSVSGHLCMNCFDTALFLFGEESESSHKLLEGNSACGSVLDLAESEIDICICKLLVNKLGVLCHLGKTLTIHGVLSGSAVVCERFLKCFWCYASFNHLVFCKSLCLLLSRINQATYQSYLNIQELI